MQRGADLKGNRNIVRLCARVLAVCGAIAAAIPAAFAHGAASGNTEGAFTPLIFVPAVIALAMFLVLTHGRKGWTVLVIGGAGYVGSALVPALLERRHRVTVLDLYPHGEGALDAVRSYPDLSEVKGDFRDPAALKDALEGCDAVIHLAPVSAEAGPGFDSGLLKPAVVEAFRALVRAAREAGVRRFVYASSFAVYGDTGEAEATEDMPLAPGTGDARYKTLCEKVLEEERASGFVTCTVRPAAVYGAAPRQRLDGLVNLFTYEAISWGRIRVPGGTRGYPSIHLDDMVRLYLALLDRPDARIDGRTYNAVGENHTLAALAEIVKVGVGGTVVIEDKAEEGGGSCRLSGMRMRRELGFVPRRTVAGSVGDLAAAFRRDDPRGDVNARRRASAAMIRRAEPG